MRRAPQWLLPVPILAVVACATTLCLQSQPRPAYLTFLRAEYMSSNPQGPYRESVSRGEVVKGMDVFSVLAAWGHPQRRLRQGTANEWWFYVDADPDSKDSVEYSLAFRDGVLSSWESHRFTSGGIAVQNGEPEPIPLPAPTVPKGKTVPQN